MNLFLLSVLCVAHKFVNAVDSISQLSLIFQWWFQGLQWLCFRWRFVVGSDADFTGDSRRQRWLCFSNDFIRQQWISIRSRFYPSAVIQFSKMISHSTVTQFSLTIYGSALHSVFDDSMRQTWIYFSYWFYASLVHSLTLSTPYVSCHSYFSGDFKVYGDSIFADDFWSVGTQFSLTIPCVTDDSVFSIDFIRQPCISIRCWLHPSPLT
jgi:hypothetical protein